MEEIYRLYDTAERVLTAAIHHTDLAESAIISMNDAVARLEQKTEKLRGQIQQEIKTSLESSIDSAEQAAKRYEKAARFAVLKVFAVSVTIGLVVILGTVLLLQRTVPTYSEIIALRKEKQQLEYTIADLAKRGGKIQLSECMYKERNRLCAKINERPEYSNGFRILAGY